MNPTSSQIERLKRDPSYAVTFDAIYGAGASKQFMGEQQEEEAPTDESKPLFSVRDTAKSVVQGVNNAVRETGDLLEGGADFLDDKLDLGGLVIGENADNGIIDWQSTKRQKEEGTGNIIFGKYGENDNIFTKIPKMSEPTTILGEFVVPISQFSAGFLTGQKLLKGIQVATKTGQFAKSMITGGIADFTVFDEHEARLSDWIESNPYEISTPITRYLESDEDDSMLEGRLKNAIEGSIIGGTLEGTIMFLGLRRAKRLKEKRLENDKKSFDEINAEESKNIEDAINESDEVGEFRYKDLEDLEVGENVTSNYQSFKETSSSTTKEIITETSRTKKGREALEDEMTENAINIKIKRASKKDKELANKFLDGDVVTASKINSLSKLLKESVDEKGNFRLGDVLDKHFGSGSNYKATPESTLLILDEIVKFAKANNKKLGKTQTWEQTQKKAEALVENPTDVIVAMERSGNSLDDIAEVVHASRVLEDTFAGQLQDALTKRYRGEISQEQVEQLVSILHVLAESSSKVKTGLGRGLNIYKATPEGVTLSNEQFMKRFNALERTKKWYPKTAKEQARYNEMLMNLRDPEQVRTFLQTIRNVSKLGGWTEKLNEIFINAILSSPKTHAINITSNTFQTLITPMELILGGALKGDALRVREGVDIYVGLVKHFNDAFKIGYRALKEDKNFLDYTSKIDMPRRAWDGRTGQIINTSGRALASMDEFFKQLNYRAKLHAKSIQDVLLEESAKGTSKINAKDFAKKVEVKFKEGFDKTGLKPSLNDASKESLEWAQRNTYTLKLKEKVEIYNVLSGEIKSQNRSVVGSGVQSIINDVPILRQIIPFVGTPTNIMREVWSRIPYLARLQGEHAHKLYHGSPTERATALGKEVFGGTLLVGASGLALAGKITGGGSKDPVIRKQQLASGWKPYSFKVGDDYYSFERLDPWGMFFGIVGDIGEIGGEYLDANEDKEKYDELAQLMYGCKLALINQMECNLTEEDIEGYLDVPRHSGGILSGNAMLSYSQAVVKNLASKTYVKGLSDFIDVLSKGEDYTWAKWWRQKQRSMIPTVLTKVKQDDYYREVRTSLDAWKSGIPYWNETLEPKYDATGRKMERMGSYLDNLVFPITKSSQGDDIVRNGLAELNHRFSTLKTKMGTNSNIDLLNYRNKSGKTAHLKINELLETKKYKNSSGDYLTLNQALEKLMTSKDYINAEDGGLGLYTDDLKLNKNAKYTGSKVLTIQNIINEYRSYAREDVIDMTEFQFNGISLSKALARDKFINKESKLSQNKDKSFLELLTQ